MDITEKTEQSHPMASAYQAIPAAAKLVTSFFISRFARLDDNCVFLTRHGLQFKLFPKLEYLQGPPYANQAVQNGMQAHAARFYISTTHSGSVFTSSLILPITTEYQGIKTSFYLTFSLVIFKTGIGHASKSLQ